MSFVRLIVSKYDEPLRRPLVTAHGRYERRAGVILCLDAGSGLRGLGDAAPLPGFSRESIAQVERAALEVAGLANVSRAGCLSILESPVQLPHAITGLDDLCRDLPSLRFALETALADLAARNQGLPLARWLSNESAAHVDVNGLLDSSGGVDVGERARTLRAAGFTTMKIKVGVDSVDDDIRRVTAVREAVPDARIRIDVNAAWDEARARDALTAMKDLNLEFVEQPLPVGNILPALRLARDAGIPLALDEEIETAADAIALIEERMCDVLVLKPMVLGGISDCLKVVAAAQRENVGIVFTSSWESDIGVAATMHLSAAGGSVCRAAGLSTAGAIAGGIVDPPLVIESGRLLIPEAAGLGFSLIPLTNQ